MKRFNELVQEIRDQAALASGGSLDRPTSFNQSGGQEQRAPAKRPAEQPPMTDQAKGRRRPTVEPTRAVMPSRTLALRTMLANPQSLRTAIVIGEILGPPVSMRNDDQRAGSQPSGER